MMLGRERTCQSGSIIRKPAFIASLCASKRSLYFQLEREANSSMSIDLVDCCSADTNRAKIIIQQLKVPPFFEPPGGHWGTLRDP